MMLYPTMPELLAHTDNSRYLLVNLIAQRARAIAVEAETHHEILDDKPVSLAINEIAEGKLSATI